MIAKVYMKTLPDLPCCNFLKVGEVFKKLQKGKRKKNSGGEWGKTPETIHKIANNGEKRKSKTYKIPNFRPTKLWNSKILKRVLL